MGRATFIMAVALTYTFVSAPGISIFSLHLLWDETVFFIADNISV